MKFYVVVNFYLVNLSVNFHKDPCINVRARVANARIRDIKIQASVAEILAKQYKLSEYFNFPCIFHIFTVSHLKSWLRTGMFGHI